MDREIKDLKFEIRAIAEDGTFEGLASTYGTPPDVYGDIIEEGAFDKTITDHDGEVVVLWQHDSREPVGLGKLESTDEGLVIKGKLELGLDTASKAYIALKAKLVKGLSIGFKAIRKSTKKGIRHLQEIKLYEVSLVTFPANERAVITRVKSAFSDAMQRRKVASGVWGAYSVLDSVLFDTVFDREMTTEDKVSELSSAIEEFKGVFLTALPEYLKWHRLSSKTDKVLSDEDAAAIREEIKSLQALLESAVSTEASAADTDTKAAEPQPEPGDAFHSDQLKQFRDECIAALD